MRQLQLTLVFVLWLCLSITPALAGTVALTTGGAYLSTTYATDPDTAGAWSTAAIDALEVGGIETAAVSTRLQDVHVYVEYTDAVASSNGSLMLMGVGR